MILIFVKKLLIYIDGHVGINEEGVNQEGIQHYMDLIDELIAQSKYPCFTILFFLN